MTASATAPEVASTLVADSQPTQAPGGRPELLIAATFVGGFVVAKILKRLGHR